MLCMHYTTCVQDTSIPSQKSIAAVCMQVAYVCSMCVGRQRLVMCASKFSAYKCSTGHMQIVSLTCNMLEFGQKLRAACNSIFVRVGYIPVQWDIRPAISCKKGQHLSEAEGVRRAKPEAHPRRNESTDTSRGILWVLYTAGQGYN